MNAGEFVSKATQDKDFLVEVFKHIPDELLAEQTAKAEAGEANQADTCATYIWPGAQAMGCDFSKEELLTECEKFINGLGSLAKIRFVARFAKSMNKAGKTAK
ncbi:MAG: hypothetical protein IJ131_04715 [Eggerthellaceae bacterium]|nr:hypothetical protein [Eggerthellaceae bacterium]